MVVEEIPILKEIIADNQKLIDDMTDRLEAIWKWGTKAELYMMGHGLRMHFDELWKILGSSEFKENSEE